MSYLDHGALKRAERFRRSREADGLAQINIWVDQELKAKLDEFVKAGGLRNRSEAVAMAVSKLVGENRG